MTRQGEDAGEHEDHKTLLDRIKRATTRTGEERSFLSRGAGAANASAAAGGPPKTRTREEDGAHAKRAEHPLAEGEKPDQLSDQGGENRQESLIDESVEETFPASDPIAPKRIT